MRIEERISPQLCQVQGKWVSQLNCVKHEHGWGVILLKSPEIAKSTRMNIAAFLVTTFYADYFFPF